MDHVTFAGYRIPHPLEFELHIQIQTDGSFTPTDALHKALIDIKTDFDTVSAPGMFRAAYQTAKEQARLQGGLM